MGKKGKKEKRKGEGEVNRREWGRKDFVMGR